jgi:hypothetical protein
MLNRLAAVILILGVSFSLSIAPQAKLVDGTAVHDYVLSKLVDLLDQRGIDIRNGQSTETPSPNARPQLTDLHNFPADPYMASIGDAFSDSFNAGVFSDRAYLVAVDSPGTPAPKSHAEFLRLWNGSEIQQRIFISFSGKDLAVARTVAATLQDQGYVVFLYKSEEQELPAANAVEVGKYFGGAGRHFVIDTLNARTSLAVQAEALALARGVANARVAFPAALPTTPTERTPKKTPSPDNVTTVPLPDTVKVGPCCNLCQEVNGVIVSCGPEMCGPNVCRNARPARSVFGR